MKSTLFLIKICLVITCLANPENVMKDKTFVKITETENSYELKAAYDPAKAKQVLGYIDESLTGFRDFSFNSAFLAVTAALSGREMGVGVGFGLGGSWPAMRKATSFRGPPKQEN